jgi:hypothetical protein
LGRWLLVNFAQGVLCPKLFFFQLMELEFLARSETHAVVKGCDALRELGMLLFEVRPLSFRWNRSSVVLGHVTSEVLSGFSSQEIERTGAIQRDQVELANTF